MQFWTHVVLVLLGMAYFLYSFTKQKRVYQILFVIWMPLTLLTYLSTNETYLTILGIAELIFFLLVIFFLFRRPKGSKGGYQSMLDKLDSYGNEDAPDASAETETAAAEEKLENE